MLVLTLAACGAGTPTRDGRNGGAGSGDGRGDGSASSAALAACTAAGGTDVVAAPRLLVSLKDRFHEGWQAAPAVADLDGDGRPEIVVARGAVLLAFRADGSVAFRFDGASGRIWSSPVVADITGDGKLDVAFAARDKLYLLDAAGRPSPGFPVTWQDEIRGLAAGDVDGDGKLDLVASVGRSRPTDVVAAFRGDGRPVAGFPPNASQTSGCTAGSSGADGKCYFAGCYDQNVAVADLDRDGKADVLAPHDNAYASFFRGTGEAFDANAMFPVKKTPGIRYLLDLADAKRGYAQNEATALQAHFTNTAPTITDLDGDGSLDVLLLGSVQNVAQNERERGVALFAVRADGSRLPGWEAPYHVPTYVAGLWDYDGTNVVGATNQVAAADLDASRPGKELVFAGFDGAIHAVDAAKNALFRFEYTTDPRVLTGGVVIADLSKDGSPEIVFATYSPDRDKSHLFVLDARGRELHRLKLPNRGAMPLPTIADVNGDGTLEIVVSLKDAEDKVESVRVYTVDGSGPNCLVWPTARGSLLRSGLAPGR
jgi:hypothetical protein